MRMDLLQTNQKPINSYLLGLCQIRKRRNLNVSIRTPFPVPWFVQRLWSLLRARCHPLDWSTAHLLLHLQWQVYTRKEPEVPTEPVEPSVIMLLKMRYTRFGFTRNVVSFFKNFWVSGFLILKPISYIIFQKNWYKKAKLPKSARFGQFWYDGRAWLRQPYNCRWPTDFLVINYCSTYNKFPIHQIWWLYIDLGI